MPWEFSKNAPVFLQIVSRIRSDVLCGRYAADEQIPSVRQLASEAAVNPNTMQRALAELENEGILCSKGTIGRFVTSDEKVLEEARRKMKSEVLSSLVEKAREIGITDSEIIDYIKNGGKNGNE